MRSSRSFSFSLASVSGVAAAPEPEPASAEESAASARASAKSRGAVPDPLLGRGVFGSEEPKLPLSVFTHRTIRHNLTNSAAAAVLRIKPDSGRPSLVPSAGSLAKNTRGVSSMPWVRVTASAIWQKIGLIAPVCTGYGVRFKSIGNGFR